MTTINDTCPCGARFEVRDHRPSNARTLHVLWLNHHAHCRTRWTPPASPQETP